MKQGPWLLELSAMADALSAKFSIINLASSTSFTVHTDRNEKIFQLLSTRIENQEEQIRLDFTFLSLAWLSENEKIFLTLVNKKCKEWTVKTLHLHLAELDLLLKLNNCHISHLQFYNSHYHPSPAISHYLYDNLWKQLDEFKQVWMKVEKFTFGDFTAGGGRGGNPETDWQRFLDHLTT